MRVFVKAKPGAKKESITKIDVSTEGLFEKRGRDDDHGESGRAGMHFIVAVKEPAIDGRANRAIERALAEYFKVPLSRVRMVRGHSAKQKVVEILDRPAESAPH